MLLTNWMGKSTKPEWRAMRKWTKQATSIRKSLTQSFIHFGLNHSHKFSAYAHHWPTERTVRLFHSCLPQMYFQLAFSLSLSLFAIRHIFTAMPFGQCSISVLSIAFVGAPPFICPVQLYKIISKYALEWFECLSCVFSVPNHFEPSCVCTVLHVSIYMRIECSMANAFVYVPQILESAFAVHRKLFVILFWERFSTEDA